MSSPDKSIVATVNVGSVLTYDIDANGTKLIDDSPIAMTLSDGTVWGREPKLKSAKRRSLNTNVEAAFYRSSVVKDSYNEVALAFGGGWSVEFRAYDDGVAYRFRSTRKRPFNVEGETVCYRFTSDATATVPYVKAGKDGDLESQYFNSFENTYTTAPLSKLNRGRLMFLPLVVEAGNGMKVGITESDLYDYPGLYLTSSDGGHTLSGRFAAYPKRVEQGGHNNLQMIVKEREPFIAKVDRPRTFPWRIAVVAKNDAQLASNNLSYLLAAPSKVSDTSWIRPGKVAWEWWNDWNLYGVSFKTGINTDTYKAYIDFASDQGIEYVILDEGWAVNGKADLMQVVDGIDIDELVRYGEEKNVGIILWAGFHAFERDMENVCRHYSRMGVKGFKVDFMDRDDQQITKFEHRAAEMCAKYKLVLDLHGSYKPAGMNRTWPNVLNFEGVNGLEQMKWSPDTLDQVKYDCLVPFLRQMAGPLDYTQGAMRNAARGAYRPCNSEPMSQGTRCRQMALYMVFDSPLNMLCDSPSNYLREPDCTEFIASVPTVWDETRILDAKMGEYIVVARRKGTVWYIGGITDWTPRDVQVDLSFIDQGSTVATLFKDGVNADRAGRDYQRETISVRKGQKLGFHLAPGGGFAMKVE